MEPPTDAVAVALHWTTEVRERIKAQQDREMKARKMNVTYQTLLEVSMENLAEIESISELRGALSGLERKLVVAVYERSRQLQAAIRKLLEQHGS